MAAGKHPIKRPASPRRRRTSVTILVLASASASSLQQRQTRPIGEHRVRTRLTHAAARTSTAAQCVTSAGKGNTLFRKCRRFLFVVQPSCVPRGYSRCVLSSFMLVGPLVALPHAYGVHATEHGKNILSAEENNSGKLRVCLDQNLLLQIAQLGVGPVTMTMIYKGRLLSVIAPYEVHKKHMVKRTTKCSLLAKPSCLSQNEAQLVQPP